LNKSLLYQALENPAALGNIPLEDLEKLREEYPWFSAAQILLAKAYQIRDDHRFTDQLRHASLFSGNRRQLYDYIRTPDVIGEDKDSTGPSSLEAMPVPPAETIAEPQPDPISTSGSDDVFFDLFVPSPSRERNESTQENIPLPEPRQEARIPEFAEGPAEPDEILTGKKEAPDQAFTSGEILPLPAAEEVLPPADSMPGNTAIDSPILPESEAIDQEKQPVQLDTRSMDILEREILAEAVSSSIEQEVGETQDDDAEVVPAPAAEPGVSAIGEENPAMIDPFAAWLLKRSTEIHYADTPTSAVQSGEENRQPPSGIVPAPRQTQEPKPLSPPDKKSQQRDLIDRFMKLDPKITPGKSSEYSTQNIARESLEEDNDLITETMAKLFALQGRLDKARKAYRRLMELHPEKSVYFAAQLKNLSSTKKG
jgi:hypothetical protein